VEEEMKKYNSLSELIVDYRKFKDITQLDLADILDVDTRTISRWEKGVSLIKPDKEDDIVEKLFLPHQVIHNLNSEHPISIYFDMESRTYSLSLIGVKIADPDLFKAKLPVEEERIHALTADEDVEFIHAIKKLRQFQNPLDAALIKKSAELLPELNLVLFDQAGFYAGHVAFIPLNLTAYKKLKEKSMKESEISFGDLESDFSEDLRIFYFYSLYADSIVNAYYLMSKVLRYFKIQQFKNYIIAGMANHEIGVNMHREMGLRLIWEEEKDNEAYPIRCFVEGNYDMYLFGKMT